MVPRIGLTRGLHDVAYRYQRFEGAKDLGGDFSLYQFEHLTFVLGLFNPHGNKPRAGTVIDPAAIVGVKTAKSDVAVHGGTVIGYVRHWRGQIMSFIVANLINTHAAKALPTQAGFVSHLN